MADDNSGLIGNLVGALLGNLVPIIVILVVLAIGGAGGFAVAKMVFSSPQSAQAGEAPGEGDTEEADEAESTQDADAEGDTTPTFTYFEFEPILVNLNDPRQARHMQLTIHLGINSEVFEEASARIEQMTLDLRDWLIVHLSGYRIEEVAGDVNKIRLKRRILNAFNDILWPEEKPLIDKIIFTEATVR